MVPLLIWLAPASARPHEFGHVNDPNRGTICHYNQEVDKEHCLELLGWVDEAWTIQVDGMGLVAPVSDGELGGSDALDIYLSSEGTGGAGGAYVTCDAGDADECVDAVQGDGRNGASAYIVIDPDTDPAQLRQYVHHEFQHVTQYATDFAEPSLSTWEGTAMAAERWTDPTAPLDPGPIADYQAAPWASAVLQDGYFLDGAYGFEDSWYEYGAATWLLWLDAQHGDGAGSVGPALWAALAQEGAVNEPDVLDAWDALLGTGAQATAWKTDLMAFEADRARMGTDAGPDYLAFAGADAYAWREGRLQGEDAVTPSSPPYPLGMSLWDRDVDNFDVIELRVDGDNAVEWAIIAVQGGETSTWWGPDAINGSAVWQPPDDGPATIGVINLGGAGFDADNVLETASFTLNVTTDYVPPERQEDVGGCACSAAVAPRTNADLAFALGCSGLLALITGSRRRA